MHYALSKLPEKIKLLDFHDVVMCDQTYLLPLSMVKDGNTPFEHACCAGQAEYLCAPFLADQTDQIALDTL